MYEIYTEINIVASVFRDQSAKDYVSICLVCLAFSVLEATVRCWAFPLLCYPSVKCKCSMHHGRHRGYRGGRRTRWNAHLHLWHIALCLDRVSKRQKPIFVSSVISRRKELCCSTCHCFPNSSHCSNLEESKIQHALTLRWWKHAAVLKRTIHLKLISLAPHHACPDNGLPSYMWRDQSCLSLLLLPVGMCWGGGRSEVSVTEREGETWERDMEPRALKYLSIRIQYGVSHTVLSSPQHLVSFLPIGWSVALLNDSSQENKCSWLPFKFMCITNTNCRVQLTGRCGFCFDFLIQYNNGSISKHQ